MANYDIPPLTPAQKLEKSFTLIKDAGLDPSTSLSRSMDAVADAIRAHKSEPDEIQALADQLSISAADLAAFIAISPAPVAAPAKAVKAKTVAPVDGGADVVLGDDATVA